MQVFRQTSATIKACVSFFPLQQREPERARSALLGRVREPVPAHLPGGAQLPPHRRDAGPVPLTTSRLALPALSWEPKWRQPAPPSPPAAACVRNVLCDLCRHGRRRGKCGSGTLYCQTWPAQQQSGHTCLNSLNDVWDWALPCGGNWWAFHKVHEKFSFIRIVKGSDYSYTMCKPAMLLHTIPCCARTGQAVPCCAAPCYVVTCHSIRCRAMLCCVMSCCAMSFYAVPCHTMLCRAMLCYSKLCRAMSCCAMSYYAVTYHAMLCHVILCGAVPYYAVPCHAMLF